MRENTYQRSLTNHLLDSSISFEVERLYPIYDDHDQQRLVEYNIPDFIVEESVIVEIKALCTLDNSHLAQVIGYLAVAGFPLGLSNNFGEHSLRYRRVFPPQKVIDHLVNRCWLFVPDWLNNKRNK